MKIEKFIVLMMTAATLTGCSDREELTSAAELPVTVSLAFSVSNSTGGGASLTRQSEDAVQTTSSLYRGMREVKIIPFQTSAKIKVDDEPGPLFNKDNKTAYKKTDAYFYYYDDYSFAPGTSSVLFYSKGDYTVPGVASDDKSYYGKTVSTFPTPLKPSGISFAPSPIYPGTTPPTEATQIANYLTDIAGTTGWATTNDVKLKSLYLNFITQDNAGNYSLIAGSSACILALMKDLYAEIYNYSTNYELTTEAQTLASAILTKIESGVTVENHQVTGLNSELRDYPACKGLPDGAAALRWNASSLAFEPQVCATFESSITNINRFAYPAELLYYANSRMYFSNKEVKKAVYSELSTWSDVLNNYSDKDITDVVTRATKAAAIYEPIQYGVAQMSVHLKQVPEMLEDANDKVLTWDNTSFPMTAVIVGGQYPVGFDFRPETVRNTPSEDNMCFVYDSQVKTRETDGTKDYFYLNKDEDVQGATNTLVLQSYDGADESLTFVLEFENRSGQKFKGIDGIVYPGTKFYLVGTVKPSDGTPYASDSESEAQTYRSRVFTQDRNTTFDIAVKTTSFRNAYNVLPDLLAPRLEVGIQLVPKWEALKPTNVEL